MIYHSGTVQGRERAENRDAIGVDAEQGIFVVVDGTGREGSEALAKAFSVQIIEAYKSKVNAATAEQTHVTAQDWLRAALNDVHRTLFKTHSGSAAYLVAVILGRQLVVAYEGDCSCGIYAAPAAISWITPVHCISNWQRDLTHRQLLGMAGRHRITRAFKAGKVPNPEFIFRRIYPGEAVLLATDGFWAEVPEARQIEVLAGGLISTSEVSDDATWIQILSSPAQ